MKVKSSFEEEGKVIGYEKGKGKYTGLTGGLICELKNGKQFTVGSGLVKKKFDIKKPFFFFLGRMSDKDRVDPPKIGAIITFKYVQNFFHFSFKNSQIHRIKFRWNS
jgi:DNA ligase-1